MKISSLLVCALVFCNCGLVSKTANSDNVIHNYEWFHDTNAAFEAKVSQIQQHNEDFIAETDSKYKDKLRTELRGMQQICRELAQKYNANSTKINRGIFKGTTLPEYLDEGECECRN